MPLALLPPSRFRFTEPEDAAAYGDGWWTWDEAAAVRLPTRKLIELEETVGMPLRLAIQLFHEDLARGALAVMWVALHLGGHKVEWDDFNPIWLATDWERIPQEAAPDPLDSGEDPPTPESTSSAGPSPESVTSSPS